MCIFSIYNFILNNSGQDNFYDDYTSTVSSFFHSMLVCLPAQVCRYTYVFMCLMEELVAEEVYSLCIEQL